MGTNYYARTDVCPHCHRGDEELHIGKSSWGWMFSLHVIPDLGLTHWEAWKAFLSDPNVEVRDEYGDRKTVEELEAVMKNRKEGAQRHPLFGMNCVGHAHTPFPYDMIRGDFS